jgi:hypothetical protein
MPFVLEGPKWVNPAYGTAVTVNWSFADNPAFDTTVDFDATITGSFRDLDGGRGRPGPFKNPTKSVGICG